VKTVYSELYTSFIKYIYPGKVIREKQQQLERSQWLSREEIEAIQLEKIQRLVKYAFENVPFYHERYQEAGTHPRDINTLEDFQSLPFVTREDIINHGQEMHSTGFSEATFVGNTSGSTGNPMQFIMETSEIWRTFAFNSRCRGWYGIKPGDKRAFITSTLEDYANWSIKEKIKARIQRCRYLNVRTMTESRMLDFAGMLVKWQPAMFRVYPSAMEVFARFLQKRRITDIRPQLIESTAEKITPAQRELFYKVFEAPVADHYASLEIYSYAYQCPESGLHVNEDRYLELVENGKVVKPGQIGDVVVTALNQYAMPLIRYKNGDVAVYDTEPCTCKRGMPVLREVMGRDCDLLVHPEGYVVHWASVERAMDGLDNVIQFQMSQPNRKNLEVRMVCKEPVDHQYLESVRQDIQPLFGDSMNITVKAMNHIPLNAGGKFRYIVSEVKPNSYN
jgi:phenylacetate-CoA ligase